MNTPKRYSPLHLHCFILIHDVVMQCLARRIQAILTHILPDMPDQLIGYASRSLLKAKHISFYLENERLSCAFGDNGFHSYFLGNHFLHFMDYNPLPVFLNDYRSTSPAGASPHTPVVTLLLVYDYLLKLRDNLSQINADTLSQLPLPFVPASSNTSPPLKQK